MPFLIEWLHIFLVFPSLRQICCEYCSILVLRREKLIYFLSNVVNVRTLKMIGIMLTI